jgi:hypothetical protein
VFLCAEAPVTAAGLIGCQPDRTVGIADVVLVVLAGPAVELLSAAGGELLGLVRRQ